MDVLTLIDDIISSILPEEELEGETPVGFTQTGHVCMSPISVQCVLFLTVKCT